ncbi:MAG: ATP-binding protein [Mediterranea sp.]|jgi:predicted AAA+ superfamily ATPase|nr:ATP-binding protein [Mediterranea sp.]
MERFAWKELQEWKESPKRKPLLLKGARQVGKTYLLKAFGKTAYDSVAYVNCDNNRLMHEMFRDDYDIERIIRNLTAITKVKIEPHKTLIILDEIQEVPKGLASLKYFCEEAPQYHVAVAGSLLGIAMHEQTSFPVGKVDMMELYPMNFEEFLAAMGEKELLYLLQVKDWESLRVLRSRYIDLLRQYYFVGGMPEAVAAYREDKDILKVRTIQQAILSAYHDDVSKHAPQREVPRIHMVFRSIPSQLGKDNKKFVFGALKKGARATEFEIAIQWLIDSGIIYKVNRITRPQLPLSFYEDFSAFKLFLLDCGLMGALANVPAAAILVGDSIFKEYKGSFTEAFVLQQMKTMKEVSVYYYSNDNSTLEIDFVIQCGTRVIPIEVKAEENLRSKSLKTYVEKNSGLKAIRLSMSDYRNQDWLENVPLYAVGVIKDEGSSISASLS